MIRRIGSEPEGEGRRRGGGGGAYRMASQTLPGAPPQAKFPALGG
jgi:hypothetical protein